MSVKCEIFDCSVTWPSVCGLIPRTGKNFLLSVPFVKRLWGPPSLQVGAGPLMQSGRNLRVNGYSPVITSYRYKILNRVSC